MLKETIGEEEARKLGCSKLVEDVIAAADSPSSEISDATTEIPQATISNLGSSKLSSSATFKTEDLLTKIKKDLGLNIRRFYSPLNPENSLEKIIAIALTEEDSVEEVGHRVKRNRLDSDEITIPEVKLDNIAKTLVRRFPEKDLYEGNKSGKIRGILGKIFNDQKIANSAMLY